jgi:hypothetical protein
MTYFGKPKEFTVDPQPFATIIDGFTCTFNYYTKTWTAYRDPAGTVGTGPTQQDAIQDLLFNLF